MHTNNPDIYYFTELALNPGSCR